MSRWRKRVSIAVSHHAADPTQYFHLPIGRTVVVGAQLFSLSSFYARMRCEDVAMSRTASTSRSISSQVL